MFSFILLQHLFYFLADETTPLCTANALSAYDDHQQAMFNKLTFPNNINITNRVMYISDIRQQQQ